MRPRSLAFEVKDNQVLGRNRSPMKSSRPEGPLTSGGYRSVREQAAGFRSIVHRPGIRHVS